MKFIPVNNNNMRMWLCCDFNMYSLCGCVKETSFHLFLDHLLDTIIR